jgi:hypothetical protein
MSNEELNTKKNEIKKTIENLGKNEEKVGELKEGQEGRKPMDEYGMEQIKRESLKTEDMLVENLGKKEKTKKPNIYTKNYVKKKNKQSIQKFSRSQDITKKLKQKKIKKILKKNGSYFYILEWGEINSSRSKRTIKCEDKAQIN